jgi:hypothetical protein
MSYEPRVTPWLIDDSEFFELDSFQQQMEFLLQYAILAPSSHNAQPWIFRIASDGVEVLADYSRRLGVVDPADRELLMSIGAAITNLRVAAAHFGFGTSVTYTQTPEAPERVAFVAFRKTCATDPELRKLFPAIKERHTNRQLFEQEPVDPDVLRRVCDVVERFHETLRLILPHDKTRVAALAAFADRQQMSQPPYREELADWVHGSDTKHTDGIAADGLGIARAFSGAAGWVLRHVDVGPLQARRDRDLIESASALIVVTTEDDRVSLVAAGEIVERLLLTITREGLHYSFFNGPIELDELRSRMATLVGTTRPAQLLLRIGHARATVRPMPRRPVEEVVRTP